MLGICNGIEKVLLAEKVSVIHLHFGGLSQRKATSEGSATAPCCPLMASERPESTLCRQDLQGGPLLQLQGTNNAD